MIEARDRMAAGLGIPPELIQLEGIEVGRPAPVVELPSMVDALEAAIQLMEQRTVVLRKVLDQERERAARAELSAQVAEWGAAAQRGLLAGYGLGRPLGEAEGVTWPMRPDDEGNRE